MYPVDAETILDSLRERQKWTTQKPTVAGYYWLRNGPESPEPQIVEVWGQNTDLVNLMGSDLSYDMDEVHGEWSGPLQPPC